MLCSDLGIRFFTCHRCGAIGSGKYTLVPSGDQIPAGWLCKTCISLLIHHTKLVSAWVTIAFELIMDYDSICRTRPLRDSVFRLPPCAEHIDRSTYSLPLRVDKQVGETVHIEISLAVSQWYRKVIDARPEGMIFTDIGVGALLHRELHTSDTSICVQIIICKFRYALYLLWHRLSRHAFKHVLFPDSADGVTHRVFLTYHLGAGKRKSQTCTEGKLVVSHIVEHQTESQSAVFRLDIGSLA